MKSISPPIIGRALILVALLTCAALPIPAHAQQDGPDGLKTEISDKEATLRFSFEGVAWREVIRWLADEAGLALHVGDLPTGSFTYSDSSVFTPDQAIDRVNLFLLPEGFALVRSGQLLSVINLGDPRSKQQLDAIAELVSVEQLDQHSDQDVVKCIFPLGDIKAEDAIQELSVMNLMSTPDVLGKTNQLIIVDTAAKLRNVKAILDAFRSDLMDNGTIVRSFALKYVVAEDILVVARPHLGLATGEMIGIDVSLSADVLGRNIFITGLEDKVKLLEGLVEAIDQPEKDLSASEGKTVLRSHLVEGGNVETVYNVLQTLLAGRTVRLSMDETSSSVVALATESVQEEIAQTVLQLQATDADFEVIPLRSADPYFVVSLLEQMLDLPDAFDDPEQVDPDAPRIDADPASMRLFVRAKRPQLEQIKKIVAGLDGTSSTNSFDGGIRFLPLRGKEAERILDTAAKFWRGDNPIVLLRSTATIEPIMTERVVGNDDRSFRTNVRTSAASSRDQRWLTTNNDTDAPAIRCQVTPRGLLVQCDDTEALDLFESHVMTIAGRLDSALSAPIVFYLKYTKAEDALRMLAELLEGGASAVDAEGGSLVNGFVSSSDSLFGTFVTSSDGMITMTAGSVTVVADSRLNRLIAQGTQNDIERIESYLQIVDKDNSITSIETYGTSHVIELFNSRASEVAEALREAFAGRVNGGSAAAGQAAQRGGNPQQQAEREKAAAMEQNAREGREERGEEQGEAKRPTGKPGGGQPSKNLEPKMTIAVHQPSNSLIITAPDALFEEAEKLAKLIDSRGEQSIEVVAPANGAVYEAVLQQVLLGESVTPRSPTPARSSPAPRPTSTPPAPSRFKIER